MRHHFLFDLGEGRLSPRSESALAKMHRERAERFQRRLFYVLLAVASAALYLACRVIGL